MDTFLVMVLGLAALLCAFFYVDGPSEFKKLIKR